MNATEAEDRHARLIAARLRLEAARRRAEATKRDIDAAHAGLAQAQDRLDAAVAKEKDRRSAHPAPTLPVFASIPTDHA